MFQNDASDNPLSVHPDIARLAYLTPPASTGFLNVLATLYSVAGFILMLGLPAIVVYLARSIDIPIIQDPVIIVVIFLISAGMAIPMFAMSQLIILIIRIEDNTWGSSRLAYFQLMQSNKP